MNGGFAAELRTLVAMLTHGDGVGVVVVVFVQERRSIVLSAWLNRHCMQTGVPPSACDGTRYSRYTLPSVPTPGRLIEVLYRTCLSKRSSSRRST